MEEIYRIQQIHETEAYHDHIEEITSNMFRELIGSLVKIGANFTDIKFNLTVTDAKTSSNIQHKVITIQAYIKRDSI